jgi:Regulator of chromosome condensation (RCC1) repeat
MQQFQPSLTAPKFCFAFAISAALSAACSPADSGKSEPAPTVSIAASVGPSAPSSTGQENATSVTQSSQSAPGLHTTTSDFASSVATTANSGTTSAQSERLSSVTDTASDTATGSSRDAVTSSSAPTDSSLSFDTDAGSSANQSSMPEQVPADPCAVKTVDAGNVHTCALGYSGWVWCWGNNSYAAVGAGAASSAQRTPYRLEVLGTDNRDVLTGQDSSCVVKNDGRLLCWGSFGDGSDWDHVNSATEFEVFGADWKQLSLHTAACAVTADSTVACWGFGNAQPRVMAGFGNDVLQVSLSLDTVCAVKGDGSVRCGRVGGAEPVAVPGINDALTVSVGGALDSDASPWGRLLATTKDGSAFWAVGDGTMAQQLTLAGEHVIETYIGETTASEHLYAAGTSDGHISTWGTNRCGALGDGLGGGGDTSHDRRTVTGQPATVSELDGYLKLAVGHEHACAIDREHNLWCWGRNAEGEIGSGNNDSVCGSGEASPNQPAPIHISLCPDAP